MDNKTILIIGVIVVIALALIFKDRIKAAFMGFTLDAEAQKSKKNKLKVDGSQNKVKQGTHQSSGDSSESNTADVKGNSNEIEQG